MGKFKFVLSIVLVTLSVLALWHFGGATRAKAQNRFHRKRLRRNDHPQRAHQLPKSENPDGVLFDHSHHEVPPQNNNSEHGDSPQRENRIEVDKEVQDKKLDDNMARKIEELKQFQKEVHDRTDEFENDFREELQEESQGA
jgi:biopolymer transport protein ExbB/TolQ